MATRQVILITLIFGIHSVISEPEDEHDTWTDEGGCGMISNTELRLTGNLVPLNLENLPDVGGEIWDPCRQGRPRYLD